MKKKTPNGKLEIPNRPAVDLKASVYQSLHKARAFPFYSSVQHAGLMLTVVKRTIIVVVKDLNIELFIAFSLIVITHHNVF